MHRSYVRLYIFIEAAGERVVQGEMSRDGSGTDGEGNEGDFRKHGWLRAMYMRGGLRRVWAACDDQRSLSFRSNVADRPRQS